MTKKEKEKTCNVFTAMLCWVTLNVEKSAIQLPHSATQIPRLDCRCSQTISW